MNNSYPIDYFDFAITVLGSESEKFSYVIYRQAEIFDASPHVYHTEEEALDDAQFIIDKYYLT